MFSVSVAEPRWSSRASVISRATSLTLVERTTRFTILLRQHFSKGTDLSIHSADEIAAVAAALSARPKKTLG